MIKTKSITIQHISEKIRWLKISASLADDLEGLRIDVSQVFSNSNAFSIDDRESLIAVCGSSARYAYREMGQNFQPIRVHSIEGSDASIESDGLPIVTALVVNALKNASSKNVPMEFWEIVDEKQ